MDIARASPHSELMRADKSAVNKCAAGSTDALLRFLSLTLACPTSPCHPGSCKARNLKERLVSYGIIHTFAEIKKVAKRFDLS